MSTSHLLSQPPYPWFEPIWQQLTEQARANRLPHALLLKSVDGIGSAYFALALAQYLLCRNPSEAKACGHCRGCDLLIGGTHPDCIQISPEDGSSVIKIAQIRDLSARIANTAQQGGRKVIVLTPAEAMNVESSNALLKNLEEPAGDTVFVLVSHQIARVLPTIRSRTSQIALPAPNRALAIEWLENNKVLNAAQLLDAVGGGPVKAMQWSENNLMDTYVEVDQCLSQVITGELSPVDGAKKMASFDILQVFDFVQQWLQMAIKHGFHDDVTSGKVVITLQSLPLNVRFKLLDVVKTRIAQLYSGSNPNKVLVCEEFLLMLLGMKAEVGNR